VSYAHWHDVMTVDVPEGEVDGLHVCRFEVKKDSIENLRLQTHGGRQTTPGTYTMLHEEGPYGGQVWMSDTDAERSDHFEAYFQIRKERTKRVLLNGLGLGMVLKAALSFDHVEHVDVVEKDERVIRLVGPHYEKDPRITIIHADAYEQMARWPKGTRWDVGWSDIWGDVSTDDLADMTRLNRSYGRRCTWHRCWGQELLR
jgi:hypothetical protein